MNANKISEAYIFDWGDTLMTDFPGEKLDMVYWEKVEAIKGALEALDHLSKINKIYVATGAPGTTPENIEAALARVNLSSYISDYFCKTKLGLNKPDPKFYQKILACTGFEPGQVTMVGDSLERDVLPCIKIGMKAIWYNPSNKVVPNSDVRQIACLSQLCGG